MHPLMAMPTKVTGIACFVCPATRAAENVVALRGATGAALECGFAPVSQRFVGAGSLAHCGPYFERSNSLRTIDAIDCHADSCA